MHIGIFLLHWILSTGTGDIDNDGDGYTENQGDCNDSSSSINLGDTDICGDSTDQDCSGSDLNCNSDLISKYMEIKHNPMCPSFEDS